MAAAARVSEFLEGFESVWEAHGKLITSCSVRHPGIVTHCM
jgi:hypothetical protein